MKTPDANPDTPDDAWDALFRQRLGDYTAAPPANALSRILANANPPRPPAYGHWLPLSLAALLLIGIGGWLFVRKANRVLQPVAVTEPQARLSAQRQPPTPVLPNQIPGGRLVVTNQLVKGRPDAGTMPVETKPELSGRSPRLATALPDRRLKRLVAEQDMNSIDKSLNNATPLSKTNKLRGSSRFDAATNRQLTAVTPQLSAANRSPASRTELPVDYPGSPKADRRAEPENGRNPPGSGSANRYAALASPILSIQADSRMQPIETLTNRPFRLLPLTATLPTVMAPTMPAAAPQASRAGRHPAWFVSLTPLYNYQQIDPIHTDAELVSDIRVARPLATDRLGGRLQVGTEWQLTNQLRLRTSLVYQQVRQSLRYAVQSALPDSVQVVVTNQSVQVTPVFTRRSYAETAIWHYTGISTDLVWQLNRPTNSPWQHYLTMGATLGRFMSRGGAVNGFVQAAYGIERPLTSGVRLRIEPTVQLGWQALTDAPHRLQSRPYGYGLALGLRFR